MLLTPLLVIALLGLGAGVGWVAGRLLHRRATSTVLPDVLQAMCGSALGLEAYGLTGSFTHGLGEMVGVALVGAWVEVGVSHATAAILRRLGPPPRDDEP
jgi:hypothetical protein